MSTDKLGLSERDESTFALMAMEKARHHIELGNLTEADAALRLAQESMINIGAKDITHTTEIQDHGDNYRMRLDEKNRRIEELEKKIDD